MKKIITVLSVLVLLTSAVFAGSGDVLNVTASVDTVAPIFTIHGSLDTSYGVTGGSSNNTIASGKDISKESITVHFQIKQSNISKYKNEAGLELTITPTALVHSTDNTAKTALPTVGNKVNGTVTNAEVTNEDASNSVLKFKIVYDGKQVAADSVIGTFTYTWPKTESLRVCAAGETYNATITLGYTAP